MFSINSITLKGSKETCINNELCPICKLDVFNKCFDCLNNDIDCVSVMGCCSHVFHFHCIDKWLKTRNVCPLDNTVWNYKKNNDIIINNVLN